jgi:RND family efflux transporter MFP subunit
MPDDGFGHMTTQHTRERGADQPPQDGNENPASAADAHDHSPHQNPPRPRRVKLAATVVAFVAVALAAYGIATRRNAETRLATWTDAQALPTVAVSHPMSNDAARALTLPGDVAAYYEAPIYARVNGYLHTWFDDIGAHVKAGQVLATIDTPDLDQQLSQARADLASANANFALAALTAKRWHALLATNSVSQQSADEKQGAAEAEHAAVAAQQAHVEQLRALQAFKRLTAPFNGVVTARNTDIGALINAGSSAANPLFRVADVHQMRVYVRVPQVYASELSLGTHATLTQPQYPGQTFPAQLAATSESVAAASRTVLVELLADNQAGKLWPGTYAEVKFDLPPDNGVLRVPSSALIFRSHGAQLATLGPGDHIVMKDVTIGRNLGQEIEITGGISSDDLVVDTPLDTLEDGQSVHVAAGGATAG